MKENTPLSTAVANITVTDPDNANENNQTHVCTMIRSDSNPFNLVNNQLIVNGTLDYEVKNKEVIRISCQDSGYPEMSYESDVTIFIDDVNDAPTGIVITSNTVPENLENYTIGNFIVDDVDTTPQYHILTVVDAEQPFSVKGHTLKTARSLNYENQRLYTISVMVKDAGGID